MWLYHCAREVEQIIGKTLYLIHQYDIPVRKYIHIIVDEVYVVCLNVSAHTVHRQTYTNIFIRVRIFQTFSLNPFESAVRAVIHMNDDLMVVCGMLSDTTYT